MQEKYHIKIRHFVKKILIILEGLRADAEAPFEGLRADGEAPFCTHELCNSSLTGPLLAMFTFLILVRQEVVDA